MYQNCCPIHMGDERGQDISDKHKADEEKGFFESLEVVIDRQVPQ